MNAESSKPDQPVKVLVAEPVAINARPISGPANVSSPVVYIYKMKGDYADRLRKSVGKVNLKHLFFDCFAQGLEYVISTRRYMYPTAISIYNRYALELGC